MKKQELIYLSKADVQSIGLKMDEAVHSLEKVFNAKAEGLKEVVPKARICLQGDDNILNAIPAYTPDLNLLGLKWVSTFSGNKTIGLPEASGLIILSDVKTGRPLALMDSTMITDLHSSAAILCAAKRLAPSDSSALGIVGCSLSVIGPVEVLIDNYDLEKILLYDADNNSAKFVADELRILTGEHIRVVKTFREAIERSDIIITARSIAENSIGTIQTGWLKEGAFIIMLDPNSYLHSDALQEISKIYTEGTKQFCQYKDAGYFKELPEIYADLIDLVDKKSLVENSLKNE
jgi:ornithine cyclodeaminase/alanine dehydrogenase-like protein (mu-crystallin family)